MTDLTQDELRKLALLCGWPVERINVGGKTWDRGGRPISQDGYDCPWNSWRPMHDANHCRMVNEPLQDRGYGLQLVYIEEAKEWEAFYWIDYQTSSIPEQASGELEARCRAALAVLDAEEQGGESDER